MGQQQKRIRHIVHISQLFIRAATCTKICVSVCATRLKLVKSAALCTWNAYVKLSFQRTLLQSQLFFQTNQGFFLSISEQNKKTKKYSNNGKMERNFFFNWNSFRKWSRVCVCFGRNAGRDSFFSIHYDSGWNEMAALADEKKGRVRIMYTNVGVIFFLHCQIGE